jgi:hypothetical protein
MLENLLLYNSFRLKKFNNSDVLPEPPYPVNTQINPFLLGTPSIISGILIFITSFTGAIILGS